MSSHYKRQLLELQATLEERQEQVCVQLLLLLLLGGVVWGG
jgi:hypothetical protein